MSIKTKIISFFRREPDWGELAKQEDDAPQRTTAIETRDTSLDVENIASPNGNPYRGRLTYSNGTWNTQRSIERGFSSSTIVYIAVNKRAKDVSRIPLKAMRRRNGKLTHMPDSEIQRLLNKPNEFWTPQRFKYIWMAHYLLSGNAITRVDESKIRKKITEFWVMSPVGIKPIKHPTKYLLGYERRFKPAGTHKYVKAIYGNEQIIHHMMPNPSDTFWGLSPLMAGCGRSVNTDEAASNWQHNMLQKGARPSGVVSLDTELEDEARTEWRDWVSDQIEGQDNAGGVLFLDGSLKFAQLSLSPAEMDYIATRKFTREELLAAFDVPPPVAGFYDNATYNNVITARLLYWENTIIPDINAIAEHLTKVITRVYGDEWVIQPDLSNVEALLAQLKDKLEAAGMLKDLGYTANQINRMLNLGMPEIEEPTMPNA